MKIYSYNINKMDDDTYDEWMGMISKEKRMHIQRYRKTLDRKLSLAGDILARKAIYEECGINPIDIRFDNGEFGKPYAVDINVHFNISHSGEWTICAIDDKSIGVDIEKITNINMDTTRHFCTSNEIKYIFDNSPQNILQRFFRIWTLKEAYFKNIGTGLDDLKSVEFFINKNGSIICDKEGYAFKNVCISNLYMVSMCMSV